MQDQIKISGITATGKHGVFAFERENGQRFSADVTLFMDFDEASKTDELTDTVDYGKVAEITHSLLHGEPVNLIEGLADSIAKEILALGNVAAVEVTIHKPSAPISVPFEDVSVTVRRSAAGGGE